MFFSSVIFVRLLALFISSFLMHLKETCILSLKPKEIVAFSILLRFSFSSYLLSNAFTDKVIFIVHKMCADNLLLYTSFVRNLDLLYYCSLNFSTNVVQTVSIARFRTSLVLCNFKTNEMNKKNSIIALSSTAPWNKTVSRNHSVPRRINQTSVAAKVGPFTDPSRPRMVGNKNQFL